MGTRSALGLIYMVQGLQRLGEDPEPVLRRHGLSSATLDPLARIERSRELRLCAELAEAVRTPLAGLQLGDSFGLAGYGPLVMLLLTCATVGEALQLGVRFQRLTYLFGTLHWQAGPRESALVLDPRSIGVQGRAHRIRMDGEVSGTFKMVRDLQSAMGLGLRPLRVDMPYPRPTEAPAYEQHFGCPVQFGHGQARFWLATADLAHPLPTADASAHAVYRGLCEQQLAAQQGPGPDAGLSARVLDHLALFNGHFPSSEEVAQAFELSERSFRRQLGEEGQRFRDLLGQARFQKAQAMLRESRLSVEHVALELGYAESAAFIHAFHRWAGMSPSAWRDQQAPPAPPGV